MSAVSPADPVATLLRRTLVELLPIFQRGVRQLVDKAADRPGGVDLVTEADLLADRRITEGLDALFPGIPVVSEEREPPEGARGGDCFVLDPVDGTHNFAGGLPWWAISLARVQGEELREAWLLEAPAGILYRASAGGPALRDGEVVRVSEREPRVSLASVGLHRQVAPMLLSGATFAGTRVLGSHALSLAWAAEGRFAVHVGRGHPWDVAAGYLLLERAGGRWCRFDGSPRPLWGHDFAVAGSPRGVDAALEALAGPGLPG